MRPGDSAEPVATYAQAKVWLWRHSKPEDWLFDPDADLPPEARLVCDMFWVNPDALLRDMRRLWDGALDDRPRRSRPSRYGGWR